MTAKQLRELLEKVPADAEVFVPGPRGFERTDDGKLEMHAVRWITSTSWSPIPDGPAHSCVVLSKDEMPLPDDEATPPPGSMVN